MKVLSVGKLLPPSLCAVAVAFHGARSSEVAVSIPSQDTGCRAWDILKLQPRRSWLGAFEILGQISLGPAQLQEEAPCRPLSPSLALLCDPPPGVNTLLIPSPSLTLSPASPESQTIRCSNKWEGTRVRSKDEGPM